MTPSLLFYVKQKIAQKINQPTTFYTVLDRKSSEKSWMFLIDLCFGNSFRFSNYTKDLYPYENDHIAIQLFIQNVNDDGNSALKLNHTFKNIVISKNYSTLWFMRCFFLEFNLKIIQIDKVFSFKVNTEPVKWNAIFAPVHQKWNFVYFFHILDQDLI